MKKTILAFMFATVMMFTVACGGDKTTNSETVATDTVEVVADTCVEVVDSVIVVECDTVVTE